MTKNMSNSGLIKLALLIIAVAILFKMLGSPSEGYGTVTIDEAQLTDEEILILISQGFFPANIVSGTFTTVGGALEGMIDGKMYRSKPLPTGKPIRLVNLEAKLEAAKKEKNQKKFDRISKEIEEFRIKYINRLQKSNYRPMCSM